MWSCRFFAAEEMQIQPLAAEQEVVMDSFLKDFKIGTLQWAVLDAVTRALRAQPEIKLFGLPCLTFKQVEDRGDPFPGSRIYQYRITRDIGKGYFYEHGSGKVLLAVSCERTYADFLPDRESAYRYKLYLAFCLKDGTRRFLKLDDLYGEAVQVDPSSYQFPFELEKFVSQKEPA